MKKCTLCGIEKALNEFNKNKSKRDGLQNKCRQCSNVLSKKYYEKNKNLHIKKVAQNNKKYCIRNMKYVADFLLKHPCVDCGEKNPVVLEFDHLKDKIDTVSGLLRRKTSLRVIKKEIEKCVVRCNKCHRIKTAHDFNWWILKYTKGKF